MLISTGGKKRCCILRDWDRTLRTVMKRAWSMEQRPQPSVPVEFVGVGGRAALTGCGSLPCSKYLEECVLTQQTLPDAFVAKPKSAFAVYSTESLVLFSTCR